MQGRRVDRYAGYFDQFENALRGSSLAHVAVMMIAELENAESLASLPELPPSSVDAETLAPTAIAA